MNKVAIILLSFVYIGITAEITTFEKNWSQSPLFSVTSQTRSGLEVIFSMHKMTLEEIIVDGRAMKTYSVPGMFLQSSEGEPNLAGTGRYIAVPVGAGVSARVIDTRKEVYRNVEVAPAPNIPLDSDPSPVRHLKDMNIYGRNAWYPESPVQVSAPMKIRGVDVVILGVKPFQYNPVSKELVVYKDIKIRVDFIGGTHRFGENRLRSRFWEPILRNHLLNYNSLPEIDFYNQQRLKARDGCEYIIIVPDEPLFKAWADTIKAWRTLQGISTKVFTLTEVGGSSAGDIENFINDAYNTWNPAPAAFLLLSDFPSSGRPYGITSPQWGDKKKCVADNFYADVDGDHLPDIHHARITAQNEEHLENTIGKVLSYEREPYTDALLYDTPLIACGWQTERWFQLFTEVVAGFMEKKLGKHPNRQYNIYSGNPSIGGSWSSNNNTAAVVDYFSNLGYIPSTNQNGENYWNSGSAGGINDAINSGTFLVQHRDHGSTEGWGEPYYRTKNLSALTNDNYVFVYSTNCLTGKYDDGKETFSEKFHRIPNGALGLNAATEVSYSFVNDTYMWGTYDCLWPDFMPDYPSTDIIGQSILIPCLAMSSGKIFLQGSGWPNNPDFKEVTYYLFHHHGDAFTPLYSEEPRELSVVHNAAHIVSMTTFTVIADEGSVIALSCKGKIIGVAEGSGSAVDIPLLSPVIPGDIILVTITKANCFRYEKEVPVISANYPFVSVALKVIDDSGNNGKVNAGETIDLGIWAKNYGKGTAQAVYGIFITTNPYITEVTVDSTWYGDVPEADSVLSSPRFRFTVADTSPNNYKVNFQITFRDKDSTWVSNNFVKVYTPIMEYVDVKVEGGNNNGAIEPGETVDLVIKIINDGEDDGCTVYAKLLQADNFITLNTDSSFYGTVQIKKQASNTTNPFKVTAHQLTPEGHNALFKMVIMDKRPHMDFVSDTISFKLSVGKTPPPFVLFEDDFEYAGTDSFSIIWKTSGNWDRSNEEAHSQPYAAYSGNMKDGSTYLTLKKPLDLSAFSEASLSFWHSHAIDAFWGDATVQMSSDGGTKWTNIWSVSSDSLPWREQKLLLTSLSREMLFRYRLETSSMFQDYSDWFIDDFKITIPDDNAPPYFANTTVWNDVAQSGPFPVLSVITDASGVENASLHYRIGSGSWKTLDMTNQGTDPHKAIIPEQATSTGRIDYYLEAKDKWFVDTANTGTDPVGACQDSGYFSFQYGVVGILTIPNIVTLRIGNYQNNGMLHIRFSLPTSMKVKMSIYNVLGQEVASIFNRKAERGRHSILWNKKESRTRAASGIYILTFEAKALKASEASKSYKKNERILLLK